MRTRAMSICAAVAVMLTAVGAQIPASPPEGEYRFIDGKKARAKLTRSIDVKKVRQRLDDAGNGGYGLHSLARLSTSVSMLLKRDGEGPRTYQFVAEGGESSLLKAMNEAGAQGFAALPDSIRALDDGPWIAVMTKHPGDARFAYSFVKGTEDGQRALGESTSAGRVLKSIVGRIGWNVAHTVLFFEDGAPPAPAPTPQSQQAYRILATARTSALESDIGEAAAEGFRIVGAATGYMAAVMTRDPGLPTEPIQYCLLANQRVATGVRELNEAGAEGFRLAALSENGQEAVYILHRKPGTSERFEYQILTLEESTANQALHEAEAEGYRICSLLSELVIMERPSAPASE